MSLERALWLWASAICLIAFCLVAWSVPVAWWVLGIKGALVMCGVAAGLVVCGVWCGIEGTRP